MVPSLYVIRWLWILAIQLLSSNSCGFILRLLALLECKSINATFCLHHTWSVLLIKNWTSIMHPYSISNFLLSVRILYKVFVLLIKNSKIGVSCVHMLILVVESNHIYNWLQKSQILTCFDYWYMDQQYICLTRK